MRSLGPSPKPPATGAMPRCKDGSKGRPESSRGSASGWDWSTSTPSSRAHAALSRAELDPVVEQVRAAGKVVALAVAQVVVRDNDVGFVIAVEVAGVPLEAEEPGQAGVGEEGEVGRLLSGAGRRQAGPAPDEPQPAAVLALTAHILEEVRVVYQQVAVSAAVEVGPTVHARHADRPHVRPG